LGKKPFIFFISAVLITLPLGYAYNSIAIVLFVLYSLLSAKKENISINTMLLLPLLFFGLMVLSLAWSIDFRSTLKALSKEASLLFIPLAFCFNRRYIKMGVCSVLKNFSIAMCLFGFVFLGRAIIRFSETGNPDVFFYHELATPEINAIYLSAIFSLPLFYFLTLKTKSFWDYGALVFLTAFIFMLSSKTVIITNVFLAGIYFIFYSGLSKTIRIAALALVVVCTGAAVYYGKIKERLIAEYTANTAVEQSEKGGVNHISAKEALTNPHFEPNDYFNGTSFRLYQIRIFTEMLSEDPIFFTGYGLNASMPKIEEKGIEHNVYLGDGDVKGYHQQNFHNQYVETFADLGVIGFLLLLVILGYNLKNALRSKDFVHIAFAILMIALLLTESFLWRQRGVVFFTIIYCLYNGLQPNGTDKEQYEKNTHNRRSRFSRVTPV